MKTTVRLPHTKEPPGTGERPEQSLLQGPWREHSPSAPPSQPSGLQNCRTIYFCGSKPPSSWYPATAATGNQYSWVLSMSDIAARLIFMAALERSVVIISLVYRWDKLGGVFHVTWANKTPPEATIQYVPRPSSYFLPVLHRHPELFPSSCHPSLSDCAMGLSFLYVSSLQCLQPSRPCPHFPQP